MGHSGDSVAQAGLAGAVLLALGAVFLYAVVQRARRGVSHRRTLMAEPELREVLAPLALPARAAPEIRASLALPPHRGESWTALFDALVPESGPASTVQGELLRATTRVSSEYSRNGCSNWGPMYEEFCELARAHLTDGTFPAAIDDHVRRTFTDMLTLGNWYAERDALPEDDPRIEQMEEAGADIEDPPFEHLEQMEQLAELWCRAHPDPIPYTPAAR